MHCFGCECADGAEYEVRLLDTGGERNERKKWIHCFENVDVCIYVAALSHFCTVLWEDENTLSLHDAIELFGEICNGKWFRKSEMILMLNKNDLFRELLRKGISLKCGFGEHIERENYEASPSPSPKHDDDDDEDDDLDAKEQEQENQPEQEKQEQENQPE